MTVNFTMTFAKPYQIGLLRNKQDNVAFKLRKGYDGNEAWYCQLFIGNCTEMKLSDGANATLTASLDLVFDYRNDVMETYHDTIHNLWYIIALIVIFSFVILAVRGIGFFSVWTLIEYMQLVALIPTYNFKMISYLYDAFKPAMISHLIFFTHTPGLHHMDKEWFTTSYKYYGLSDARLIQGCIGIAFLCFFLGTAHLICHLVAKTM